ncbi:hypothetical protein L596_002283 [Steinernema carpocapsae]|uniref:Uncharacterized protein n=1 Tax=Steinernema carpocapsae TaxID=34508 RepID=A0A4U8UQP4_STECR|nr:hypothetical protein L596_002283 [Steinernema carpocapsae]
MNQSDRSEMLLPLNAERTDSLAEGAWIVSATHAARMKESAKHSKKNEIKKRFLLLLTSSSCVFVADSFDPTDSSAWSRSNESN